MERNFKCIFFLLIFSLILSGCVHRKARTTINSKKYSDFYKENEISINNNTSYWDQQTSPMCPICHLLL